MKQAYISTHLADAQSAGARFHLNPIILLAQAALESGWGTSRLAREANNHFGITGYGASNAFWHGGRVIARYKRGELLFRRYDSARNSYLDFARLLVCSYPQAAAMSRFPADYAKAIAYSPYISELNGDDREVYRCSLVSIERTIRAVMAIIQ